MGRRTVDIETLATVKSDLRIATEALKAAAANLSPGIGKIAQDDDEPPADIGGDAGDLGDDFDEGTTGEEGGIGDDLGGEGDLGDLGGDLGGAGFGGGGLGGGFGEDAAPEDAADSVNAEVNAEVDGLRTEVDAIKRTLVDISKTLRMIRNPLGDPASGNDAMQSV